MNGEGWAVVLYDDQENERVYVKNVVKMGLKLDDDEAESTVARVEKRGTAVIAVTDGESAGWLCGFLRNARLLADAVQIGLLDRAEKEPPEG